MYDVHLNIDVKYFDKNISELKYNFDWVDVRVADGVTRIIDANHKVRIPQVLDSDLEPYYPVPAGTLIKVPLGIGVKLPEHSEAIIRPRGSLSKETGLLFATSGVVDEGYCGDNDQWFVCLYATRDCRLYYNQRIAQFRIQAKQLPLVFNTVEKLGDKDRGGHGSTGKF